jgi:hypothetical protein
VCSRRAQRDLQQDLPLPKGSRRRGALALLLLLLLLLLLGQGGARSGSTSAAEPRRARLHSALSPPSWERALSRALHPAPAATHQRMSLTTCCSESRNAKRVFLNTRLKYCSLKNSRMHCIAIMTDSQPEATSMRPRWDTVMAT